MKLNEEKELKKITDEFTRGVDFFTQKECKKALEVFSGIIKEFEDSEYYSVLEIHGRSKVYNAICESRINPVKPDLESEGDYLNYGIFNLNAGHLKEALELFNQLEEKGYKDPYLNYLFALAYLKQHDKDTCLKYLKKCIKKDDHYKVIAHNEPEFSVMFENEEFQALIMV